MEEFTLVTLKIHSSLSFSLRKGSRGWTLTVAGKPRALLVVDGATLKIGHDVPPYECRIFDLQEQELGHGSYAIIPPDGVLSIEEYAGVRIRVCHE